MGFLDRRDFFSPSPSNETKEEKLKHTCRRKKTRCDEKDLRKQTCEKEQAHSKKSLAILWLRVFFLKATGRSRPPLRLLFSMRFGRKTTQTKC